MANVDVAPAYPSSLDSTFESTAPLLVSVASVPTDQFSTTLDLLSEALSGIPSIILTPDVEAPEAGHPGLTLLPLGEQPGTRSSWVLSAPDFQAAHRQAVAHGANGVLLLGPDPSSLEPSAVRSLVDAVHSGNADLAVPSYVLDPRQGLVNSALLYPLTRALYGTSARFPLALDLGLSLRMSERLAAAAQRQPATSDGPVLLWPVAEAAVAGYRTTAVTGGHRALPPPDVADLNSLLAQVASSLFADIEAKAATWQRSRPAQPSAASLTTPAEAQSDDSTTQSLLDSFRVAYTNLSEIWSLVLPPQSLLGLKKLSVLPTDTFRMPPALWARVVYDFVLAFRLRTLNRGHLLGALTPLYLAWVASHLLAIDRGEPADHHVEQAALAFESEKPYFVSRWRWPDRFNP